MDLTGHVLVNWAVKILEKSLEMVDPIATGCQLMMLLCCLGNTDFDINTFWHHLIMSSMTQSTSHKFKKVPLVGHTRDLSS